MEKMTTSGRVGDRGSGDNAGRQFLVLCRIIALAIQPPSFPCPNPTAGN